MAGTLTCELQPQNLSQKMSCSIHGALQIHPCLDQILPIEKRDLLRVLIFCCFRLMVASTFTKMCLPCWLLEQVSMSQKTTGKPRSLCFAVANMLRQQLAHQSSITEALIVDSSREKVIKFTRHWDVLNSEAAP